MDLVVLAGGLGTRLREAVPDLPKPMAPVAGRPFVEHVIKRLAGPGVTRLVLSTGYKSQVIQDHFGHDFQGIPIEYVVEQTPLGTGGALLECVRKAHPKSPFFLVNGDTFFPVPLAELVHRHRKSGAAATLALRRVPDGTRYSSVRLDSDGALQEFLARGTVTDEALINGGVYVFGDLEETARSVDGPCSLEDDLIPRWIREGRLVQGFVYDLPFVDIGVPEDYARAPEVLAGS